ncbi:hypothetical protein THAOC_36306, partial [Thalassiosira oceanica]
CRVGHVTPVVWRSFRFRVTTFSSQNWALALRGCERGVRGESQQQRQSS